MNLLKTYTFATELPDTFLVYWTNSVIQPKGVLRVRIQPEIPDRIILAELAAMRHLLEDKGVAGKNIIGNAFTKLVVSSGAIRKLQAMRSDKSHLAPYANFLTTRFADGKISVSKDSRHTVQVLATPHPTNEFWHSEVIDPLSSAQHCLGNKGW